MRKVVGIFGGSFNPIHRGHIMLAQYLSQHSQLDEVWLTLSPQNPLKVSSDLLDDNHRLAMLQLATKGVDGVEVCDIELTMPRPSYTINTLERLSQQYTDCEFRLVIGGDNWTLFDRWKDYQRIIDEYGVVIYPRPGYELKPINDKNVVVVEAPLADVSSTEIRGAIAQGENIADKLPAGVWEYIKTNNLYKK